MAMRSTSRICAVVTAGTSARVRDESRRHAASGRCRWTDMAREQLLDLRLRYRADDAVHHRSALEEEQRGDRRDPVCASSARSSSSSARAERW
jgi:hypothetical protein